MNKYITNKLRDTEKIYKCEPVVAFVNKKARDCHLALICSKRNEFELA